MVFQTKIATCCYCGARTALKLSAREGHELACGRCGAPLHEMKPLKLDPTPQTPPKKENLFADASYRKNKGKYQKSKKKKKPRKGFFRRALEEVWDEVEDIFD